MTPSRTRPAAPDRPSPWAVVLFVASTGLALASIVLLFTGYGLA